MGASQDCPVLLRALLGGAAQHRPFQQPLPPQDQSPLDAEMMPPLIPWMRTGMSGGVWGLWPAGVGSVSYP